MSAPSTLTRTDHALSIQVDGTPIGHIQEWTPQQSLTVTPVYELKADTSGTVIENSPGNIGGLTVTVNRFDLFTAKMEEVWGLGYKLEMLTDQKNAINVQEYWLNPDGSSEVWWYDGCWFTSLGRTHSAQGDRITKVNASMMYVKKYRVN